MVWRDKSRSEAETGRKRRRNRYGLHMGSSGSAQERDWVVGSQILTQVLHSRCSWWYMMTEPYNTTKFKLHLGTCKAKGNECNTSITAFFKPRDPTDTNTEAKTKVTVSGRKQMFIGSNVASIQMSIKPPHTDNNLLAQSLPCHGISAIHNPRVSTYISWTVVEGAGSITLEKATKKVYGDNIKYSELTDNQKAMVAITQSHLRSWSINCELRVVFSTNCIKFIEQDRHLTKTICSNCEEVAQSEPFK